MLGRRMTLCHVGKSQNYKNSIVRISEEQCVVREGGAAMAGGRGRGRGRSVRKRSSETLVLNKDVNEEEIPPQSQFEEEIKTATSLLIAAAAASSPSPSPFTPSSDPSSVMLPQPCFFPSQFSPCNQNTSAFVDSAHHPEEAPEDEDERYLVGFVEVNVVGLQYYHGTVNNREMVRLIREPDNAYDCNAIRVENMQGEQVGHVERYKACYLAPIIDDGSALVEGIVPRGSKNAYRMPCQVFVFSKYQDISTVLNRLVRSGASVVTPNDPSFEDRSMSEKPKNANENTGKSIDKIFDSLVMEQNKATPTMDPSPDFITTRLYSHQKKALAWLVGRESSIELPPFWREQAQKRDGKVFYVNTLTNFMTEKKPKPFRGGILADEMGLGKTLTLISLIATNRQDAMLHSVVENLQESTSGRPKKKKKLDDLGVRVHDSKGTSSTLIVCPLSVMPVWVSQLEEHTVAGSLKVYFYHGPDRTRKSSVLGSYDIVLTTYNILASEGSDGKSPLQDVNWLRVVLDEAHLIKNPNARMTRAAVSLQAERRWAVTGTPIQNGVKDLLSLMMFLKLQPLDEKSFWNRTIQRPLLSGDASGFMRLQALLLAIALRRTKDMKVDDKRLVDLPRRTVTVHKVELGLEDRRIYDRLELEGKRLVGQFVESGTVLQNYSTILQIILRLRQICDHSSLCPVKEGFLDTISSLGDLSSSPELLQKLLSVLQSGDDFDCPICLSPPSLAVITKCSHIFCRKCIEKTLMQDKEKCPMCRVPLAMSDLFTAPEVEPTDDRRVENTQQETSAKIKALIQHLTDVRVNEPTAKSVVFSQFSGMLSLVQSSLEAAGFKYVRLDGSMNLKKREAAVRAFQSKGSHSPSVFLLSLKAAGVGLNLVAASRVYMLDPWWNPAVEEQAMDRVHRMGQKRDVEIVRLIVQDSIEERILGMQERKRNLASGAFKQSAGEMRQGRIEDVQRLMQL